MKMIKHLIVKDLNLEWRQKYAISGAMLYIVSTIYITYLVFKGSMSPDVWTALFWIILVFVSIHTVSRSFLMEGPKRHIYYQTLASPQAVILSKIFYNNMVMALLALLTVVVFALFFGAAFTHPVLFYLTVLLGSVGLSSVLTVTSAIAWRAGNSIALVAILSFPLTLPLLIILVQLTRLSFGVFLWPVALKLLLLLFFLNIIVVALGYILFPFIWKD